MAQLSSRYPSPDCVDFNTELSSVWQNFYQVKRDQIEPVRTRGVNLATSMNNLGNEVETQIVPVFTQIEQTLQGTYSSVFDPQYGLLSGLDCRVVGEDMSYTAASLCNHSFVHSFILRIMFIISGFSILVLLCCVTCLGCNNYRAQTQQAYPSPGGEVKTEDKFLPYFVPDNGPNTNVRTTSR